MKELGYNYRMTDFQAALGVGQIKRCHENLKEGKGMQRYSSILHKEQIFYFQNLLMIAFCFKYCQ